MNPAKKNYNLTALFERTKPTSCFPRRILGVGFFILPAMGYGSPELLHKQKRGNKQRRSLIKNRQGTFDSYGGPSILAESVAEMLGFLRELVAGGMKLQDKLGMSSGELMPLWLQPINLRVSVGMRPTCGLPQAMVSLTVEEIGTPTNIHRKSEWRSGSNPEYPTYL